MRPLYGAGVRLSSSNYMLYSQHMAEAPRRRYRKRKRAEDEQRTRQAIVEAVMDLHRTVGPANTTVTEVGERAGVTRMTVYKHFPTDFDLIEACSSHWAAQNPFPGTARWERIADPDDRLSAAVGDLYRWYRGTEDMMGNVLRDAPLLPALGEIVRESWGKYLDGAIDALMAGRPASSGNRRSVRAAIRLALDFATWRTLTRAGLSDASAARLASALPAAAISPASRK